MQSLSKNLHNERIEEQFMRLWHREKETEACMEMNIKHKKREKKTRKRQNENREKQPRANGGFPK